MRKIHWMCLPALLLAVCAHADDWSLGGYLKAGSYGVKDPDGDTEAARHIVPAVKVAYNLQARGQRLFTAVEYLSFALDAEPDTVAQDVEGYSLLGGYERKFAVTRAVKVWLSGALSASSVDFKQRALIADDGYLDTTLENRSANYLGASAAVDTYVDITHTCQLGVGVFVDIPFGDGVKAAGVRFIVQQY